MRLLRRVSVTSFACIARAELVLGPGLNVLFGPNDSGKSTLAAAIRAALLLPTRSSEANRYVPWRHDAVPQVELDFVDVEDRAWRVKKSFSSSGTAELLESRDGSTFTGAVAKGREVDDQLRTLLKLGIKPPGGKGAPRGLPESFLADVLLSDQTSVDKVLRGSLETDGEVTGRMRLAEALQAVALDKSLKAALDRANLEVDRFWGETGKRRSGKTSPYAPLKQRVDELTRDRDELVRLRDHAVAAEERVAERQAQYEAAARALTVAEARVAELRAAQQAWRRIDEADTRAREATEILLAMEARQAKVAAIAEAAAALAKRAEQLAIELEAAVRERAAAEDALRLAEDALRRMEDRDAQAQREIERHELQAKLAAMAARAREADLRANDVQLVHVAIATQRSAEASARDADSAVRQSERRIAAERAKQGAATERRAHLQQLAARARERRAELANARALAEAARGASSRTEAERLGGESDILESKVRRDLPDRAAQKAIAELEQAVHLAEASLGGVGMTVTLRPKREVAIALTVDGVPAIAGTTSDSRKIEARGTVSIGIEEIIEVDIAAGGEEARRAVEMARRAWNDGGAPVLARAGAASVGDLIVLCEAAADAQGMVVQKREAARRLFAEADECDARAATFREAATRDAPDVAPTHDREALDRELAAFDAGGSRALERETETTERELVATSTSLARSELEVAVQRERLARARVDFETAQAAMGAAAEKLGGRSLEELERWLISEREEIAQGKPALERAIAALDSRASDASKNAEAAMAESQALLDAKRLAVQTAQAALDAARSAAAREAGALDQARGALTGDDLATARVTAGARAAEREALPRPPGPRVDDRMLGDAIVSLEAAEQGKIHAKTELASAEGASTTTDGVVAKERYRAVEDAYHAACEARRDLELDADAWQLLRDTLREVERDQGQHLGRALAEPLRARVEDLTHGRYRLDLGPSLQTHAIAGVGFADLDDALQALSVGTREQLATLLRLTIAESLGAAILLDDHLVQSDSSRLTWFRELLREAAARTQVIVFTCKPEDYVVAGEGDERLRAIDLAPLVKRLERLD